MLLVHLFVCFVCVSFSHFSRSIGIGGWLRFVTMELPGLFYDFFRMSMNHNRTLGEDALV